VALDTCAAVPWSWLEPLVDAIDLVLLDVKLADDARHRAATGHGNGEVLENLARLARADVPLWIRTPVIPGFTDDEQNVAAIGSLLRPHAAAVQRWELVAYTDLGRPKYEQLGRPYRLAGAPLLRRELLERLCAIASEALPVARWKGATDAG